MAAASVGIWNELPSELIWMVMERLHMVDNIRLSTVCRHWRYAFTSFPNKLKCTSDGIPWIIRINKYNVVDNVRPEFFRFSTETTYKFNIQDFNRQNFMPLCSKKGWLLIATDVRNLTTSLLLVNPVTEEKILMPIVEYFIDDTYQSAISILDGIPNLVVLARVYSTRYGTNLVRVKMARPGDQSWRTCIYESDEDDFKGDIMSLCIIGNYIYFIDQRRWILVFDMVNFQWKDRMETPADDQIEKDISKIVESDGEIFRVDIHWNSISRSKRAIVKEGMDWNRVVRKKKEIRHGLKLTFYRLNMNKMKWETLSETDINGTAWFIGDFSCFLAKGKQLPQFFCIDHGKIFVGDINKSKFQRCNPTSDLSDVLYHWVDMD